MQAENPDVYQSSYPHSNGVFVLGQIGDWKNYFDEDLNERFDAWIAESSRGIGLQFQYE